MKAMMFLVTLLVFSGISFIASAKTAVIQLKKGANCVQHIDTDDVLVGQMRGGQYVHVRWIEGSKQEDGNTLINIGEAQFVPVNKKGVTTGPIIKIEAYYDGGWYIYRVPVTGLYALVYYNRGYTPDLFKVDICILDVQAPLEALPN